MSANTESEWHFVVMIGASFIVFIYVIRFCLTKQQFTQKFSRIILLAFVIAVGGMFLGKFGANLGLPWWIYYPIPMMMTVFIPPVTLAMTARQTGAYLVLSLFSAPFIHSVFSFILDWHDYLPFWIIPHWSELVR